MVWEPWLVVFFLVYLAVSALGLVNLIVGVIVENTTTDGKKEVEDLARDQYYGEVEVLQELKQCIGKDRVTIAEIEKFLGTPEHMLHLQRLELKPSDLHNVFKVLAIDGSTDTD